MTRPETILVVDDDEDFVLLLQWAFEKAGVPSNFIHLNDGREVMRYFRRKSQTPSLILLDVHLPVVDGFEVLHFLRSQKQFASIPILMLTSSESESEVLRARQMGATDIQEKPFSMTDLLHLVEQLRDHWLAGVA